ncbi:MAG: hypothetical protein J0L57_16430 [Burkholderiales bacterium]|nr:hypothetical protein [Burkholderiales bacterium]
MIQSALRGSRHLVLAAVFGAVAAAFAHFVVAVGPWRRGGGRRRLKPFGSCAP